ncbi:hypothetical protein PQU92_06735 [Asticcacaulis sp. BYS171W]|uniref:Uncharacterized protein n=1 Tax=Asticcacaulis aquaticus TaxID=2984212 RepID=A0ABT5HSD1_9CAUL|nr:hypothetical protein [Asticcacaulis aquaticus]MDC7682964.1 hypothetical protein [Asticcacaulis aquaticus]
MKRIVGVMLAVGGLIGAPLALADSVKSEMILDGTRMKFADSEGWYSFRTPVTGETTQSEDGSRVFMWDSSDGKYYFNVSRGKAQTPMPADQLDANVQQMITPGSADDLSIAKDVTAITGREVITLNGPQPVKMAVWHVEVNGGKLFYGVVLVPKGSMAVICLGDRPDCGTLLSNDFRIEAGAF